MPRAERAENLMPNAYQPVILAQAVQGIAHALSRDAQRKPKTHDDFRYRNYKQALAYNPSHQGERRKKEFRQRDLLAERATHAFTQSNKQLKKEPAKMERVEREFPPLNEVLNNLLVTKNDFTVPLSQLAKNTVRGEAERSERAGLTFLPNILGHRSQFLPRLYRALYGSEASLVRVASGGVTLRADESADGNGYRFETILTNPSENGKQLRPIDMRGALQEFAQILWNAGRAADEIKRKSGLSLLLAEVGNHTNPQMQIYIRFPSGSDLFSALYWKSFPDQTLDLVYRGKLSVVFLEKPSTRLPSRRKVLPFIKGLLAVSDN